MLWGGAEILINPLHMTVCISDCMLNYVSEVLGQHKEELNDSD